MHVNEIKMPGFISILTHLNKKMKVAHFFLTKKRNLSQSFVGKIGKCYLHYIRFECFICLIGAQSQVQRCIWHCRKKESRDEQSQT